MASEANKTSGSSRRVGWAIFLAAAVLLGGIWWRDYRCYHFAVVQQGVLYRDGNRSEWEFDAALRRAAPKTVISLVDDSEMAKPQFQAEVAYCKERGIDLVRIPIKLGGWPTSAEVQQFLGIAGDKQRQPVLVHCAQGVRRTGMMVAAFEESMMGYDAGRANDAILSFGHSDRALDDVHKFIEIYDAKARRLRTALPDTPNE